MPLKYEYVTSHERLGHIANELVQAPACALDLETVGYSPLPNRETRRHGKIRLCSLNTMRGVYVIDLFHTKNLGPVGDVLNNPTAATGAGHPVVVGQNLKFDQKFLKAIHNIELWPIFDTYRASAVIHNGKNLRHDLYELYGRELARGPEADDLGGSDWDAPVLTKNQLDYAAEDVTWLLPIRDRLRMQLTDLGFGEVALTEFGVILPEAVVELNGLYLNREKWLAVAADNILRERQLRDELSTLLPHPRGQMALPGLNPGWNFNSTQQMLASLHSLGIKVDNTREQTLAMFASKYPVIEKILAYREVATQLKSFGEDYVNFINPVTGRIHSDYFPLLVTGRYAHSNPNLGQVPRDKKFRGCFEAPDGWVFIIADYSNIEMRLAAHISGDPKLIETFRANKDAHRVTASIVMGVPESEVSKAQRQAAKAVNFGLIYGMMPPKLIIYAQSNYKVTLSPQQAQAFWNKYFEAYRGVRQWHQRVRATQEQVRSARSIIGRIRHLDPQKHYNEFLNHPVQSSGADGLKRSLRNVYYRLKKYGSDALTVHHVHDEIVLQVRKDPDLIASAKHDLEHGMIEGMSFMSAVPASVEAAEGATWADKA